MHYSYSHALGEQAHIKEVVGFVLEEPEEFQSLQDIFFWMDLQEKITQHNHPLCQENISIRHFSVISTSPLIHASSPNSPSKS